MPLVQGPGTAGALDGANGRVKVWDGTDVADVLDLTTNNGLAVAIVDGNGDQITSFGGGTQYTEDAAAAANPVGTAVMLVRDDAPGALVSDDGDNVAQRGTNFGAAFVQVLDSSGNFIDSFGGAGGTSAADDADFTATTTLGTPAMGVFESTPSSVTDGDLGIVGITTDRRLKVLADLGATDNAVLDNIDADLTTIIGHVDGLEALLTTIDADTSNLSVVGGGTEAAAIRVTIANNSTGVLSVDDNGGNISVDWAGTVPPIGAGTEAAALRVTLATDSTGVISVDDNGGALTVDNGGTFAVQVDGAALTALQLIDNIVPSINGPGAPTIDSYTQAAFNLTAAADQVLVSSAANKQIWVYGIGFVLSAAGTVSFQDEDNTAITGIMPFAANSGMAISPSGNFAQPLWKLGTDKDFEVDLVTAEMDGWVTYAIVSV